VHAQHPQALRPRPGGVRDREKLSAQRQSRPGRRWTCRSRSHGRTRNSA